MPQKMQGDEIDRGAVRAAVLAWYDRHQRVLPWRAPPGQRTPPYAVWLSEVMLQQTTVAAVKPYFERFLQLWPRVEDLAAAESAQVMTEWAGLGYYARARNLHACAKQVADQHGGAFPDTVEGLRSLPGIGGYTAAAIAAIAFDRPVMPVDGNIERVAARLFAFEEPLPGSKKQLVALAESLAGAERPGDYAQALMDLGATICTPTNPRCLTCPLESLCLAKARGIAGDLPARAPKKEKPTRRGQAYWAVTADGRVLLRRRPAKGLLGGMEEIPSCGWDGSAMGAPPVPADWRALPGQVRHTFTHFHLEMTVLVATGVRPEAQTEGEWVPIDHLGDRALPSLMRKVVKHVLGQAAAT